MLTNAPVTTILPVLDMNRARDFYQNKLGLTPQGLKPDGKFVYSCGNGALLALFQRETGTRADHTALSFELKDITATLRELKETGVVFNDYDFPGLQTVNHVCVLGAEKAAWFDDTEGNMLCLHEVIS